MSEVDQIKHLLSHCSAEQKRQIFQYLRTELVLHPLEQEWNVPAEVILGAIARASDLTRRGLRGIIAEAAFEQHVLAQLTGWQTMALVGDYPYDFILDDGHGQVRIQVKMQRLKNQRPMQASEGYRHLPEAMFVVETQRTRRGTDPQTGEDTRPYRFSEFDILAVSLHPATADWTAFRYTVARWLLPRPENSNLLLKFQPVPQQVNTDWTDDLETCIRWFREASNKTIMSQA